MLDKLTTLLVCALMWSCNAPKEIEKEPFTELTELVDQYAEQTLNKGNINAVAIAVCRNGKTYHNYYGEIDLGGNNPPNDNTLFEAASISKVFVGSLVAKAVTEKRIAIDDDIRKYLEPNAYSNLAFEGTSITVSNLLTHTLGFETPERLSNVYDNMGAGYYQDKAVNFGLNDLFEELKQVTLNKEPGTYYDYNNVGPEIAAYILEQVYEEPYEKLLAGFFNELGMNNSYLQDYDRYKERLARGYGEEGKSAYSFKRILLGGAGGVITTLPDLVKFMKFQLEGTDPLIKESTRVLKKDDDDLGYFWNMGVAKKEGFYYYKTGTSKGIQSGILLCPDSNYGQIIIVNNTSEAAYEDWGTLYNSVETELIQYPKINLKEKLKPLFLSNLEAGKKKFNELSTESDKYFNTDLNWVLNRIGYDLLESGDSGKAINVFKYAISEYPEDANLYNSLGEAFLTTKDYDNARKNYQKSLELNPGNAGAKELISRIDQLTSKQIKATAD